MNNIDELFFCYYKVSKLCTGYKQSTIYNMSSKSSPQHYSTEDEKLQAMAEDYLRDAAESCMDVSMDEKEFSAVKVKADVLTPPASPIRKRFKAWEGKDEATAVVLSDDDDIEDGNFSDDLENSSPASPLDHDKVAKILEQIYNIQESKYEADQIRRCVEMYREIKYCETEEARTALRHSSNDYAEPEILNDFLLKHIGYMWETIKPYL